MKRLLSILLACFAVLGMASAQTPQGINFQGVARDAQWQPLGTTGSHNIVVQIWDGTAVVYSETHSGIQTNPVGLFNIVIGKGVASVGVFSNINWASGAKSLEISVDGVSMGKQQMVSVPYALYAPGDNWGTQTAQTTAPLMGNGTGGSPIGLQNGTAVGQTWVWNGIAWVAAPAREVAIFEYAKGASSGSTVPGFNKVPLHNGTNTTNISLNVAGNTFTLQPGTYLIQGYSSTFLSGRHQVVVRNVASSQIVLLGTNEYTQGVNVSTSSKIFGKVTIGTPTTYILDHWVEHDSGTGTDGFGVEHTSLLNTENVYARVIIEKI